MPAPFPFLVYGPMGQAMAVYNELDVAQIDWTIWSSLPGLLQNKERLLRDMQRIRLMDALLARRANLSGGRPPGSEQRLSLAIHEAAELAGIIVIGERLPSIHYEYAKGQAAIMGGELRLLGAVADNPAMRNWFKFEMSARLCWMCGIDGLALHQKAAEALRLIKHQAVYGRGVSPHPADLTATIVS
jgi:hypothetical protein